MEKDCSELGWPDMQIFSIRCQCSSQGWQRFGMDWLRHCRFGRWISPTSSKSNFPTTLTTEYSPNWSSEAAGAGGWLVVGGAWQSVASGEWVGRAGEVPVTGCHLVRHGGHLAAQLLQHEGLLLLVKGGGLLIQRQQ